MKSWHGSVRTRLIDKLLIYFVVRCCCQLSRTCIESLLLECGNI